MIMIKDVSARHTHPAQQIIPPSREWKFMFIKYIKMEDRSEDEYLYRYEWHRSKDPVRSYQGQYPIIYIYFNGYLQI